MLDVTEPDFTRRLQSTQISSLGIAHLLYGADIEEERAETIVEELNQVADIQLCRLEVLDEARCFIHGPNIEVNLFEFGDLEGFARSLAGPVAVDLTSLEHRVWAPLIKALVACHDEVLALYAEPNDYRRSDELPGAVYDLSTGRGIEPLPGFARLARRSDDEGYFAPLLGFEGARLGHIFDQEEVELRRTSPIIGSPGFRVEYPTYTYLANRDILEHDRMDRRVEYARASCPFEAYRAIERIHAKAGGKHLRVAPIGTKPHALGAVLYAIQHSALVELIYDHPVRSKGRTRGSRGVYVYEVSSFLRWIAP
ncbi:hypothetical protein [Mycetocola manganoxydans]|uniref:hypothetical protein n=1 Tax=Mycetocola manganoxydans TaxID=699879 RepID=UPI0011C497BA|nr:hypothetical protein [Mycetocola manganoxydans]GHD51800.1 hypothetical protein GCM10008097_27030 [Mycetocola manganoxydans]